jgi:hypothetical protein
MIYQHDKLEQINILEKLREIIPEIIGEENAISIFDLFYRVYNIKIEDVSFYERQYWIDKLRIYLNKIQELDNVIILHKNKFVFIPTSDDDVLYYKKMIFRAINGMKSKLVRLENFVKNKEYKKIKKTIKVINNKRKRG